MVYAKAISVAGVVVVAHRITGLVKAGDNPWGVVRLRLPIYVFRIDRFYPNCKASKSEI